jgi:hypothetical protein
MHRRNFLTVYSRLFLPCNIYTPPHEASWLYIKEGLHGIIYNMGHLASVQNWVFFAVFSTLVFSAVYTTCIFMIVYTISGLLGSIYKTA